MTDRSTQGRRNRANGHAWEREVARRARAHGIEWKRNLTETREGNTGDHDCGSDPFATQCKYGKRPNVWRALREAEDVAGARFPVAFVRRAHGAGRPADEMVAMRPDDWLELVSMLKTCGAW